MPQPQSPSPTTGRADPAPETEREGSADGSQPVQGAQPGAPAARTQTRAEFSALELQQMAATAAEVNPFLAGRGNTDRKWQEVADDLHDQGLCLESSKDTIKHKVNALIKYHEVRVVVAYYRGLLTSLIEPQPAQPYCEEPRCLAFHCCYYACKARQAHARR